MSTILAMKGEEEAAGNSRGGGAQRQHNPNISHQQHEGKRKGEGASHAPRNVEKFHCHGLGAGAGVGKHVHDAHSCAPCDP